MPDYCKCENIKCRKRAKCARYLMIPSDYQTSSVFEADDKNNKCKFFMKLNKAPFLCYNDVSFVDNRIRGVKEEC